MNQNPYESTAYGPGSPGSNNPYEQYPPNQPAPGPNPYPPNQPASGPNPYPSPPYGAPSPGQVANPYPQSPYGQQSPNPYSYPNPNTPPAPVPAYNQGGYTPAPPPRERPSSSRRMLLIALIAIVVLAGIIAAIAIPIHNTQVSNDNATATAQTNGTVTARNATAVAQTHATATAQVVATATAIASIYPFSANVKLNDPLTDNSHSYGWKTGSTCTFTGGAFHDTPDANTYSSCLASSTDFSNFTYQVTMQIVKGGIGGITFRGDAASNKGYAFIFSQAGSYVLFLYTSGVHPQTLQQGTASAFNTGTGQSNDIGVVAQGSSLSLYVNKQKIASVSDSSYNSGKIGVIAYNVGSSSGSVDVAFTNAKVWGLQA